MSNNMYSITTRYYYEYEKRIIVYDYTYGLTDDKSYADYREINEEEKSYLKDNGFNLVRVDYGLQDEKPQDLGFETIEDDNENVYIPFENTDEAIKKKTEYTRKQGNNHTYRISFAKFISLSDIESFYRFTSYIQIGGRKFPYIKSDISIVELYPDFDKYKDKFYIKKYNLNDEQMDFLKERGFEIVTDTPEEQFNRCKYEVFPIGFSDIEGFVIEREYCDINDFGKEDPKLTGKKEIYFLDREHPDPEVWEMLEKYHLIIYYDV